MFYMESLNYILIAGEFFLSNGKFTMVVDDLSISILICCMLMFCNSVKVMPGYLVGMGTYTTILC